MINFQAIDVIKSKINKQQIYQILCEVKAEQKLIKIFDETKDDFDVNLLPILIESSFESMILKFKHDCFQHNPHMNYLKISVILRQSMNVLCCKMDTIISKSDRNSENDAENQYARDMRNTMTALCVFLKNIFRLQQECMIYVEVSFINKFITEQMLRKLDDAHRLIQFAWACLNFIENSYSIENIMITVDLSIACDCLAQILRIQSTFNESDNFFKSNESSDFFNRLLSSLYEIVRKHLASESFLEKNQLQLILSEPNQIQLCYVKAIFLGAFVESQFNDSIIANANCSKNNECLNSFKERILSLVIATMRYDTFYIFAVTPREIINSIDWLQSSSSNRTITFQSVPIDCLNEIEIVEKFLKR